jgi:membrane protein implicated in regulation of membrane protease activity
MTFTPELIWFLVGLALILLEFAVPGVVLAFFGAGAWLAALTTWTGLTDGVAAQLWVFAISSLLLLMLLRRRIRARLSGYTSDTQDPNVNLDEFRGQKVTVLAAIAPGRTGGRVEYKGAGWAAVAETALDVGEQAVIVGKDGITLEVRSAQADTANDDLSGRED